MLILIYMHIYSIYKFNLYLNYSLIYPKMSISYYQIGFHMEENIWKVYIKYQIQ